MLPDLSAYYRVQVAVFSTSILARLIDQFALLTLLNLSQ
jgi:hypothetical protein